METMKQAIMVEPGKIVFEQVEIPEMGKDQVRLAMKRIGICGSDMHVYHGAHVLTQYPVVQGHEVSAEVVACGDAVTNVKVGDKVTVQPQVVCGTCYPCTHGMYNDCDTLKVMGFQTVGMGSEYFVVDAKKVLPLPSSMTWDQGAMIEPLAVAVHAVRRYAEDLSGKNVLVFGGGPIGNLVAQTAKAMGAEKVLLTEFSQFRIDKAKKCGIIAFNPNEKNIGEMLRETCGPDCADVFFECIGHPVSLGQAIEFARKGSDIVVVGVFGKDVPVDMNTLQDHELTLRSSQMYREEDYIKAIELVAAGLIEFDELITHHVSFDEFLQGYEIVDKQKEVAMKVMVIIAD